MKIYFLKKIFPIVIFLLITNCDYNPIYSSNENNTLPIAKIIFEGDSTVSNFIKSKLRRYETIDKEKGFKITVNSSYNKNIISKDINGNPTNYEIFIKSNFKININNKKSDFSINKKFLMKSLENKFEENSYEKNIIDNICNQIAEELINYLTNYDNQGT